MEAPLPSMQGVTSSKGSAMQLSIRNQLPGKVTSIQLGEAMAIVKVALDGSGQSVTSSITREAVDDLKLTLGSSVTVLIKSTEVSLAVD